MKALVVDRDEMVVQLIRSKLEPIGHEVEHEVDKNKVIEHLGAESKDIIFLDPAPLSSPRPVVLNIRRSVGHYPYILLLSNDISQVDAIKAGTNDVLNKPLDPSVFDEKIDNAERLTKLIKRIGDDSEDFPSAGGVIAKSAFNQLFLSAIDRADRYGERTFILFISLSNYNDVNYQDGQYAADFAVAKLSQHLVRLRRQSDIIGQTEKYEYALILQRPVYETEPVEAANRFAEELSKLGDIVSQGKTPVEVKVMLLDVPIGQNLVEHTFCPGKGA